MQQMAPQQRIEQGAVGIDLFVHLMFLIFVTSSLRLSIHLACMPESVMIPSLLI